MQSNTNYLAFQSLYFDFILSLLLTTIKYAKSYSKFVPFFLNDCYFPISHIGIIKNLSNYVLINDFFSAILNKHTMAIITERNLLPSGFHFIKNECVINWLQFCSETNRYYEPQSESIYNDCLHA